MSGEPTGWAAIPNWLIRDPRVSGNIKILFALLSSYAGADGVCFPSQQTMADQMGCSVPTVKRLLNEMRDLGLIESWAVPTPHGRANRYRLTIDRLGGVGSPAIPPMGSNEGGVVSPVSRRVVSPMTPEEEPREEEPRKKNPPPPRRKAADAGVDTFERFWDVYPRKVGKRAAEKAYMAALERERSTVILSRLRLQLPTLSKREERFIPHPSTWLNEDRWADVPKAEPENQFDIIERYS